MQSEQIAGILALLETIGKGMEYLQSHEDAKTARAVLAGGGGTPPALLKTQGG